MRNVTRLAKLIGLACAVLLLPLGVGLLAAILFVTRMTGAL